MTIKIIYEHLPAVKNMWMRRVQAIAEEEAFQLSFNEVYEEVKRKRPASEKSIILKEAVFRYVKRRNLCVITQLSKLGIDFSNYEALDLTEIAEYFNARPGNSVISGQDFFQK